MINLYDIEAVKTFIFNILMENQELRQQAINNQSSLDIWFKDYQAQKERAEEAERRVKELQSKAGERMADAGNEEDIKHPASPQSESVGFSCSAKGRYA